MSTLPPSETFVGHYAKAHMEDAHGELQIRKQLASGVAVHFGDHAMFIPGRDAERLRSVVIQKIEELACAYAAWDYAVNQPQEGDGMS